MPQSNKDPRKQSRPPASERSPAPPNTGDQFDAWFPRIQRTIVLVLGTSGVVYATVTDQLQYLGTFGGLLLWQGYQELKKASGRG